MKKMKIDHILQNEKDENGMPLENMHNNPNR